MTFVRVLKKKKKKKLSDKFDSVPNESPLSARAQDGAAPLLNVIAAAATPAYRRQKFALTWAGCHPGCIYFRGPAASPVLNLVRVTAPSSCRLPLT